MLKVKKAISVFPTVVFPIVVLAIATLLYIFWRAWWILVVVGAVCGLIYILWGMLGLPGID